MGEDVVKDIEICLLAGRVGSQDPHQISGKDVNSKLVSERRLAAVLVGTKKVPLLRDPLLLDMVVGTVHCHQTTILHIAFETAFKQDLRFCEGGGDKQIMLEAMPGETTIQHRTHHFVCQLGDAL